MCSPRAYANSRSLSGSIKVIPDTGLSNMTLSDAYDGTAIAKALDYSLKCEVELKAFLGNGQVPIDNNHVENTIRPIALGRKNFLFLGSEQSGTSSAAVMSLINSAKMNGLDPLKYMTDVLTRLPTHPNSRIEELFPHNWQPLQN